MSDVKQLYIWQPWHIVPKQLKLKLKASKGPSINYIVSVGWVGEG